MSKELLFTLPIYWTKSSKKGDKTVLVSLNWYRNAHFVDQNQFKRDFEELVKNQTDITDTVDGEFTLDIKLYYKNPSCDGSNVVPLISKTLLDALQSSGVILQDNVIHHIGTTWAIAGQDKLEPRAEIKVIPIKEIK
jgi:Holliday junction resolvase RusA-like endonuclease